MSLLKVNTIRHSTASSDAITLASDGTATAKITNTPPGNRNLMINGAMTVAQRGTSDTTSAQTFTTVDRWSIVWNGLENVLNRYQESLSSSDTGPWEKGFKNAWKIENGNQTGGADANGYINPQYGVEAYDLANSGWVASDPNSKLTLSFWVKSSVAQTFYGYLYVNDGGGDSYAFSYALSANTWTKVTKTIPGHADLAVNSDNGAGMTIYLPLFLGTDRTTSGHTLNQWQSWDSANRTPDSTTTWYTTDDATWHLTGIQLEVGDTATDYEHRSYADELFRCKRYYQTTAQTGTEAYKRHGIGYSASTSAMYTIHYLNPPMRAVPSETSSGSFRVDGHTTRDITSVTYQHPTQECVQVVFNDSGGGMNADTNWIARANNDTSARVNFEAEL